MKDRNEVMIEGFVRDLARNGDVNDLWNWRTDSLLRLLAGSIVTEWYCTEGE